MRRLLVRSPIVLSALLVLRAIRPEWVSCAPSACRHNLDHARQELSHDLRHHIEEEESPVFDAARQVLTREEERQIGAAFEK